MTLSLVLSVAISGLVWLELLQLLLWLLPWVVDRDGSTLWIREGILICGSRSGLYTGSLEPRQGDLSSTRIQDTLKMDVKLPNLPECVNKDK